MLIEDANANMRGVLEYFHKFFKAGDYVVVEDTNLEIVAECGMESVSHEGQFEVMGANS